MGGSVNLVRKICRVLRTQINETVDLVRKICRVLRTQSRKTVDLVRKASLRLRTQRGKQWNESVKQAKNYVLKAGKRGMSP